VLRSLTLIEHGCIASLVRTVDNYWVTESMCICLIVYVINSKYSMFFDWWKERIFFTVECRFITQVGYHMNTTAFYENLLFITSVRITACSDQHILIGADEGIYTLNLNELHESSMELVSLCVYHVFMSMWVGTVCYKVIIACYRIQF